MSTPAERTEPRPNERLSRNVAVASVAGLILLCLAWELALARTGGGTLALKALPLLAAPVGLWRYRLYTYRWLALVIWLYVLEGLVRSTSEGGLGQGLAVAEVVLSLTVFTACTAQIRQRLAAAKVA
ncbi:MAG: DUF2069 domain-containing protein [Burkholderiales bacterium]|nr:MAG: DUF2069 domain-containing protein [Burkholderiales bacterium]